MINLDVSVTYQKPVISGIPMFWGGVGLKVQVSLAK